MAGQHSEGGAGPNTVDEVFGSIASVFYNRDLDAPGTPICRRSRSHPRRRLQGGARRRFSRGLQESDPSSAQAFYELGNAHWMLGKDRKRQQRGRAP